MSLVVSSKSELVAISTKIELTMAVLNLLDWFGFPVILGQPNILRYKNE